MKSLTVCVGYDDLLDITLPRNAHHFTECLVITTPDDERTHRVVKSVPNARLLTTDAFYQHSAKFNKGLAVEEGFDALGRDGWLCVWDADIIMPSSMNLGGLCPSMLYSAQRLILKNVQDWSPGLDWARADSIRDVVFAGYFHVFHANDVHLKRRPWYDVTFAHAGGGDGYFQSRWTPVEKVYLPFKVLHLGPPDTNWCGRITRRVDGSVHPNVETHKRDMRNFLATKGWRQVDGEPADQYFDEHVKVPGHSPTGFRP